MYESQVLAEQQNFAEADKLYDDALKIDHANPNIYIHKGYDYFHISLFVNSYTGWPKQTGPIFEHNYLGSHCSYRLFII